MPFAQYIHIMFPYPTRLLFFISAASLSLNLASCRSSVAESPQDATTCSTPATVRDLSGLDGCGKVLELAGGKHLLPSGSSWTSFASTDGQRVVISYQANPQPNICMAGEGVTVTCIRTTDAAGH